MKIICVITAHNELSYLKFALDSALENRLGLTEEAGSKSEIRIMLDRPSQEMVGVARALTQGLSRVSLEILEFGDVCKVRNFAVSTSQKGSYIAFLDADDLWGQNWLSQCEAFLRKTSQPLNAILHPKLNYYFGEAQTKHSRVVFQHVSSTDTSFDVINLATANYWSALAFSSKEIFEETPYVSSDPRAGIGFEDWTFNIQTLRKGIQHIALEETVHFIRDKVSGSRRRLEAEFASTFYPSKLWLEWTEAVNK